MFSLVSLKPFSVLIYALDLEKNEEFISCVILFFPVIEVDKKIISTHSLRREHVKDGI